MSFLVKMVKMYRTKFVIFFFNCLKFMGKNKAVRSRSNTHAPAVLLFLTSLSVSDGRLSVVGCSSADSNSNLSDIIMSRGQSPFH